MQFIESSIVGVRAAVLTLARRDGPMRFVLFPMVHVGEPAFYEEVTARLRHCALIVAEGGPAGLAPVQERSARLRMDGLVDQTVALDPAALGIPVFWEHPGGGRPRSGRDRVIDTIGDSVAAAGLRLLGRHRDPRDMASLEESEAHDDRWASRGRFSRALREVVVDRRDEVLVKVLAGVHLQRGQDAVDVGVVWGAAHMPAVVEYLRAEYRYYVKEAEWLMVRNAPS